MKLLKFVSNVFLGASIAGLISLGLLKLDAQANKLSEVSNLKAENFKLKYQLYKQNCDSSASLLEKERVTLEDLFRIELKADEGSGFDWNTMTFKKSTAIKENK